MLKIKLKKKNLMARKPPSGPGPPNYRTFMITFKTPNSVGILWGE